VDARAHFRRLFAHDAWANRATLESLERARSAPVQSLERFAHVLAAERLWYERLAGLPQSTPVWPAADRERARAELEALAALWDAFVAGLDDARLAAQARYVNSKGEPWTSTTADVLTHVALHSSYHRGQIAADLRATGEAPAYTDFIQAARTGLLP